MKSLLRRSLLRCVLFAPVFISGCGFRSTVGQLGLSDCEPELFSLDEDRDLALIGGSCLDILGMENVEGFLDKDPSLIESLSSSDLAQALSSSPIADRISLDFEKGRTISLDGWILSETEARSWAASWLLRCRLSRSRTVTRVG